MEEVPAHVHLEPIVTDVLSRHGDRETCYTDLQCSRFGRNLFQCYSAAPCRLTSWCAVVSQPLSGYKVKKEPLEAWILRAFTGSETDDDLILRTLIWCTVFDCSQLPTHTLVTYRDQLDFMPSDQVCFTIACIICN
ncbi:hypothetical protein M9H77_33566 [Catharanthus roseus]|uniref:Uncharacterized protein n=1 Tax=Catharanthus roseus TaxID=4058 RepID=A0ACB9ZL65_CATRO|nr:hypothetical protein M9H77_33566 [Catharanthus roseus]